MDSEIVFLTEKTGILEIQYTNFRGQFKGEGKKKSFWKQSSFPFAIVKIDYYEKRIDDQNRPKQIYSTYVVQLTSLDFV